MIYYSFIINLSTSLLFFPHTFPTYTHPLLVQQDLGCRGRMELGLFQGQPAGQQISYFQGEENYLSRCTRARPYVIVSVQAFLPVVGLCCSVHSQSTLSLYPPSTSPPFLTFCGSPLSVNLKSVTLPQRVHYNHRTAMFFQRSHPHIESVAWLLVTVCINIYIYLCNQKPFWLFQFLEGNIFL